MKIIKATALENYMVHLTFENGVSGDVDLSSLAGKGVFQAWDDYEYFQRVTIGEFGELRWNDTIDLCPDALYLQVTGKSPDEQFASLKKDSVHA